MQEKVINPVVLENFHFNAFNLPVPLWLSPSFGMKAIPLNRNDIRYECRFNTLCRSPAVWIKNSDGKKMMQCRLIVETKITHGLQKPRTIY